MGHQLISHDDSFIPVLTCMSRCRLPSTAAAAALSFVEEGFARLFWNCANRFRTLGRRQDASSMLVTAKVSSVNGRLIRHAKNALQNYKWKIRIGKLFHFYFCGTLAAFLGPPLVTQHNLNQLIFPVNCEKGISIPNI